MKYLPFYIFFLVVGFSLGSFLSVSYAQFRVTDKVTDVVTDRVFDLTTSSTTALSLSDASLVAFSEQNTLQITERLDKIIRLLQIK